MSTVTPNLGSVFLLGEVTLFSLAHRFLFVSGLLVLSLAACCTRSERVDVADESVVYRPALQPANEYTTVYESSPAAQDAYLRWHAAHEKLVAAVGAPRLAFLDAHRRTLAAFALLQPCRASDEQSLASLRGRYEQLAQQFESGASQRMLLRRYATLCDEIIRFVQPGDSDYPGGQAKGRPASR